MLCMQLMTTLLVCRGLLSSDSDCALQVTADNMMMGTALLHGGSQAERSRER